MTTSVVAIIGRPNVGKSTFFNRVLGQRRAVVHDRPGITRDRNAVRTEWAGRPFLLVDTGGFVPTAAQGRDALVRRQAEAAIGGAHVVVFMVDALTGATDLDQAIAQRLRKHGRPCLLVVNKVDRPGDARVHDFHRLGLGEPIPISSENGYGIGDLLDAIVARLPADATEAGERDTHIAIVGRPNVGKSSLVNALLGEDRMVVEAEAGTTLDAVDSEWRTESGTFTLVDTAGIRRQAHFDDDPEFFGTLRALGALVRADLACVVVDATIGFQRQEARLVGQALDAGCTVQLLYNKWDLLESREQEEASLVRPRAALSHARQAARDADLGRRRHAPDPAARHAHATSVGASPAPPHARAQPVARDRAAAAGRAEHASRPQRQALLRDPDRGRPARGVAVRERAVAPVGGLPPLPAARLRRHVRAPRHAGALHVSEERMTARARTRR
jgi:ribosome-associated GTPase EngA